jgi:LMBR1 domain-containing protein 1
MPFTLIKGKKSLEFVKNEIEEDIGSKRDKIREIELKSARSNTRMTRKEKKEKAVLEKQLKSLMMKNDKIEEKQKDSSQLLTKILKFLTPFRVMLGVIGLVFSLMFFLSLFFGAVDRLINSDCGFKCGFVTSESTIFNPLDYILVYLSTLFPLDYLIFGLLVLYIFIATIYGIACWGIRFLCVSVIFYLDFCYQEKANNASSLISSINNYDACCFRYFNGVTNSYSFIYHIWITKIRKRW